MKFALLGSGSEGNATLIESGNTSILLDCGFSLKETIARLARLERDGSALSAILLTHEHSDHAGGIGVVARRFNIPVWMTPGTFSALEPKMGKVPPIHLFNVHELFEIGDIQVQPFPVPHDAREPSQFVFTEGDVRLGFLTDTGSATAHIESMLHACQALVLECNHDREMLYNGVYPPHLKERIGGSHGHLDNDTAADILSRLDTSKLECLVAAHLSQKNNTPALARAALSRAINCDPAWVQAADQKRGLPWRELSP